MHSSTLKEEITEKRASIHTDGYPMSIGELSNLYRDGELDIHPEFQRFFRWSEEQKSRLIESLLLGIPIPSVFVQQTPEGNWDVIDGLQRLSTIFQCMGILKDEKGRNVPKLVLQGTKYLPSLQNKIWGDGAEGENLLGKEQELIIKRSKLDIKIVLRESDDTSKYELFQRLNTGGSPASAQEIRNCMLIMVNRDFYTWLIELARDDNFALCVSLTERATEEQYDVELVSRFLVFRKLAAPNLNIKDLGEFLTERLVDIAQDSNFDREQESKAFHFIFDTLANCLEDNSFRRFDKSKKRFAGSFLISAFEAVALGLGYNYENYMAGTFSLDVRSLVEKIWGMPAFRDSIGSGVSPSSRIPRTLPFGRKHFEP